MQLNAASEKKLARVKPDLVSVVRRAAELTKQAFQIVQGNRTQAEQNALYAQGRTRPGNIVTWTKNSKHIGGNAIDFAALVNNKINWDTKFYPPIANAFKAAAKELGVGIVAGIDWKTRDWGHIQLEPRAATPKAPAAGKGWTLSDVQTALNKHGHNPGPVDGILGKKTRAALTAFQKAKGLPETGAPDKATTDELAKPAADPNKGTPRWTYQRFRDLGWSRLTSIALTANMQWESGGGAKAIKWDAHGDKGRDGKFHSHGASQWNDRHGRYQGLLELAAERGTPWDDPETQVRYMDQELRGTEKGIGKQLEAATTLKDAMKTALKFWRPSIPHADKRNALAANLDKEIPDE
jgi:hypothetical protein